MPELRAVRVFFDEVAGVQASDEKRPPALLALSGPAASTQATYSANASAAPPRR